MLALPVDVHEAIIRQLFARKDKATVKSLSLVCSSLTHICQRHLLSHLTITCPTAQSKSERNQHSSHATQELLQASPHLIPIIRSLSIIASSTTWRQIDLALLHILQTLTNLNEFTWKSSSFSSHPARWAELPHPLQDAVRVVIRRPSLTSLVLHFADLTELLNTTIIVSPSLRQLRLQGTGYSNLTLELTRPSIIPCDDTGNPTLQELFVTTCKLEWIDAEEMFFGWMTTVQPHLSLERLHKLAVLRCILNSTQVELPWGPLLYHESVRSKLEELWFDLGSTRGPPAGTVYLDQLPSLRRLGLTADLSGIATSWNLISSIAQLFEVENNVEITHLALGFSFSTTSLVLNPLSMPWLRLDAAVAALPSLKWVGIQVIDCRCQPAMMIPENSEFLLPILSEKGVLHWSTSGLEFPHKLEN